MALGHSPKIITDGLVFYYDMANSQKSWKGAPTTNICLNNGFYSNWANSGTGVWDADDQDMLRPFSSLPLLSLLVTATGNLHISHARSTILAGETYTVSTHVYIPTSAGTLAGSTPYIRTDPANTGRGNLTYNGITDWNSWPRDTWIRISQTFTNTANDTAAYISCYLNTLNNKIYFTGPQVENLGVMSAFTGGAGISRSNTQSILDLVGDNTVTANSLTYNSDGSFSFNGSSNTITIPKSITSNAPYSVLQWVRAGVSLPDTTSSASRKTPLVGPGPVWNPGYWLTGRVFRVHANTEYRDVTINWVNDLTWHQIGQIYDGTTCYTVIDGQISLGTRTAYAPGTTTTILVGSEITTGNAQSWNGDIGITQFYNKALTADEVLQNFNAQRSRYGV